jgi:hypothetical protein
MCHLHHLLGILLVTNDRIVKEHRKRPEGPLPFLAAGQGARQNLSSAPPRNQKLHDLVGRMKYAILSIRPRTAYFVRPT